MKKTTRTAFYIMSLFLAVMSGSISILAQTIEKPARIAENTVKESNSAIQTETSTSDVNAASSPILTQVGTQASQTKSLSLDEAIRRALENNNDIEVAKADVRFQETQLRALRGTYDPIFSFTPTYTRNSTTGSQATRDFRVPAEVFANLKNGGNIRGFFNNTRTENRFSQAQLSSSSNLGNSSATTPLYSSALGVQFTQPLWRNFRIDNTRRQIKIQRKRLQQSDADFRRQVLEIIAQVQRTYWDLVFALRDRQNRVANLNLARENMRIVEARIAAGSAAPLERAEVATELANRETEVLTATRQISIAENTLKRLILRESTSPEWSESYMPTDQPVFSLDAVNIEDAMRDATDNRPELRRLRLQREINSIEIDYFKNQTKPQIDLNASYQMNGLAQNINLPDTTTVPQFSGNEEILRQNLNTLLANSNLPQISNPTVTIANSSPIYGGYGTALKNIFRADAANYTAGVTISFPLRNKTAEANLAGARIQQEQLAAQTRSQEITVVTEVRNAVQAVETARQQVLSARTARENAQIQLEGERKLYEFGRSTTFLLFQRENALANARNAEIRAETDYNKALADLQRATSSTFRLNNIEIETIPDPDK